MENVNQFSIMKTTEQTNSNSTHILESTYSKHLLFRVHFYRIFSTGEHSDCPFYTRPVHKRVYTYELFDVCFALHKSALECNYLVISITVALSPECRRLTVAFSRFPLSWSKSNFLLEKAM